MKTVVISSEIGFLAYLIEWRIRDIRLMTRVPSSSSACSETPLCSSTCVFQLGGSFKKEK